MKTIKKFWQKNGEDITAAGLVVVAFIEFYFAMWIFA